MSDVKTHDVQVKMPKWANCIFFLSTTLILIIYSSNKLFSFGWEFN